jgi:cell division protein FtsL
MSAKVSQLRTEPSGSKPVHLRPVRRCSRSLVRRGRVSRYAPLAVLSTICVAAVVFAVLLEQVILAQSAFKLSRIRQEITSAEAENQELLLEITNLQNPGRVERYAREELGMVEPARLEYIVADVRPAGVRLARAWRSKPIPATGQATAYAGQ